MFHKIFIENDIKNYKQVKKILNSFNNSEVKIIERYNSIFGKTYKPYLQKRDNLNLFLAKKRGILIKKTPDNYGLHGESHYYFINSYNCIYECQYCYLQGYFNSPDIVLFLNYKDIINEIENIYRNSNKSKTIWFHAGEFSDSLALSHLSGELNYYFDLFKNLTSAKLELRTKSNNITQLLKQQPIANIITTFSLSPHDITYNIENKTPSLKKRLEAIEKLHQNNFPIGIHFDPIIYSDNYQEQYENLLIELNNAISLDKISYISLGVIRFTPEVFAKVKANYPKSKILGDNFIKSFDNKIRYSRPKRTKILLSIKELCIKSGIDKKKIYLCME